MYQDETAPSSSRRFIFSDDFYNNLDNNESNDTKVEDNAVSTIEIPGMISTPEYKFDSNGVVINDNSIPNNNYIFDSTGMDIDNTVIKENNNEPTNLEIDNNFDFNLTDNKTIDNLLRPASEQSNFTFDQNGVVTADNSFNEPAPVVEPSNFTFDQNGVVTEDNSNIQIQNEPEYKFDSNGIVTEDNNSYNVDSGINTELESQLLNEQFHPKLDIVVNTPVAEEDEGPKLYRATRRKKNNENAPSAIGSALFENQNKPNFGIREEETKVDSYPSYNPSVIKEEEVEEEWHPEFTSQPIVINEKIDYYEEEKNVEIHKSDVIPKLKEKEKETGKISILARYGDDFCERDYITNPAIGRDEEIKQLGLILITPEKSAILVGKPGIGKTSIVEGLAYRIQRDRVPNVLKGYSIISVKTTSLLGTLPNGETRLQTLIDELADLDKIILFIDEIHMLMNATNESGLDFANMFKESLGRGNIKIIGATTSDEYEHYVLRDKAFVRRFQKVDVEEPTTEQTVEILMGTLPKIEKKSNAKLKYTHFIQVEIMNFIVNITSEYKRVYGIGSRYPDICITLLNQAFSEAIFDNRNEVNILDIRKAIENSKNIYPDVIRKELINFDHEFKNIIEEES